MPDVGGGMSAHAIAMLLCGRDWLRRGDCMQQVSTATHFSGSACGIPVAQLRDARLGVVYSPTNTTLLHKE